VSRDFQALGFPANNPYNILQSRNRGAKAVSHIASVSDKIVEEIEKFGLHGQRR
jgi:hypothetical protein